MTDTPNANAPTADRADFGGSDLDVAIDRVQRGQREPFRHVVDLTLPMVRAYVVSRSLPGIDVDDVVQRTFVEAYQNLGSYTVGTNFRAWVVTIARYQLLMETSRLRRQADYHSRYVPHALADQLERQLGESADGEPDRRLEQLRHCVDRLPEASQAMLRSRYGQNASLDQIAAAADRTNGAVRKQLCLIRRQLRECITRRLRELGDGPAAAGGLA